jgi:hypothetical protein
VSVSEQELAESQRWCEASLPQGCFESPSFRYLFPTTGDDVRSIEREIDERGERAAKNQSLFREVNERIEELDFFSSFFEFVCECADRDCTEHVPLTLEEYEDIRQGPNRFFVVPGHELADVEEVVDSSDRYIVVAKIGAGAAVARRLDPRQRQAKP